MRLYLAGPYSAPWPEGIAHNIEVARRIAAKLWEAGHQVFCPHMACAGFEVLNVPESAFLEFDGAILQAALPWGEPLIEGVVMLPGWERSVGAKHERTIARALDKRVYFWPHDREELCA